MKKNKIIYKIGIDEVGRGPIAGPVALCAVLIKSKDEKILKDKFKKIKDSKKLSEKQRNKYFNEFQEWKLNKQLYASISMISAIDIDKIGIVKSIQKALDKSLENVLKQIEKEDVSLDLIEILLDGGLSCSKKFINQKSIIKGDEKEFVISVASIIAKVLRDKEMIKYGEKYPKYKFENHKGYGTKAHFEFIKKFGIIKIHRKTFIKNY